MVLTIDLGNYNLQNYLHISEGKLVTDWSSRTSWRFNIVQNSWTYLLVKEEFWYFIKLKQKEKLFTWQVITAYNRPLALLGIKLSSKTSVPFGTWLLSHLLQQLKQKMLMKGKRCANLKNRTATSQMLGTLYDILLDCLLCVRKKPIILTICI